MDWFFTLPPLHPLFVNFTAGLIPISIFSDILGRALGHPGLSAVGRWLIVYAAALTPLTALTGWLWLWEMQLLHQPVDMMIHQWLGTALAAGLIPLAIWRWKQSERPRPSPRPSALYLLAASLLLLATAAQGHIGALMTFGSSHDHHAHETPSAAPPHPPAEYPAGPNEEEDQMEDGPPQLPPALPDGTQWRWHIDLD